jgi:hypothetical protein
MYPKIQIVDIPESSSDRMIAVIDIIGFNDFRFTQLMFGNVLFVSETWILGVSFSFRLKLDAVCVLPRGTSVPTRLLRYISLRHFLLPKVLDWEVPIAKVAEFNFTDFGFQGNGSHNTGHSTVGLPVVTVRIIQRF